MTREEAIRRVELAVERVDLGQVSPHPYRRNAEKIVAAVEAMGLVGPWKEDRRVPRFDATDAPHAVDTHAEQPSDPASLLRLFELERKECLPPHFASVTYLTMAQRDTLIKALRLLREVEEFKKLLAEVPHD